MATSSEAEAIEEPPLAASARMEGAPWDRADRIREDAYGASRGRRASAGQITVDRCNWQAGCHEQVIQTGRGRPRKYCPAHANASAAESKREYKRARKRQQQEPHPRIPPCCADWRLSGRGRRICP